jgi:glutathione S-transferase
MNTSPQLSSTAPSRALLPRTVALATRAAAFLDDPILVEKCGVKLLAVDNFQDVPERRSRGAVRIVGNWFRDLIDETVIVFLALGTEQAKKVRFSNDQVRRRIVTVMHIPYFDSKTDPDLIEWLTLLKKLDARLPMAEPSNLDEPRLAAILLLASNGILDYLLKLLKRAMKSVAYLAMNPLGKMPVLEHDGQYVIESEVICQYLEDLYPTPTILPGNALARARARTVSRVVDLHFWPDVNQLFHQVLDPTYLDSAAIEVCKARLATMVPILDSVMAFGKPWAAGEFSLADCTLLPRVLMMQKTVVPAFGVPDLAQGGPNLGAWWKQVNAASFTSAFVPECYAATDAYLAMAKHG